MNDSVTEMFEKRNLIRDDLAASRRHIYAVMRNPAREVAAVPIGDALCWCEGLSEAAVSRILAAVGVPWGKRISLISELDQKRILWQIKSRMPEVWEKWRVSAMTGRAA
jgi:hypothetical protein